MTDASDSYGMTPEERKIYLAQQRENGFQDLDQKKRLFVLNFIETGSYTQAASAAKVGSDTGKRWLRDPLVQAFKRYLNEQQEHYSLIDAGFVETQYLQLFAKLTGEEAVAMVDKDGRSFEAKQFQGAAAVSCLKDLAKISGHYKEDGSVVNVQVNTALTDAQRKLLDEQLNNAF